MHRSHLQSSGLPPQRASQAKTIGRRGWAEVAGLTAQGTLPSSQGTPISESHPSFAPDYNPTGLGFLAGLHPSLGGTVFSPSRPLALSLAHTPFSPSPASLPPLAPAPSPPAPANSLPYPDPLTSFSPSPWTPSPSPWLPSLLRPGLPSLPYPSSLPRPLPLPQTPPLPWLPIPLALANSLPSPLTLDSLPSPRLPPPTPPPPSLAGTSTRRDPGPHPPLSLSAPGGQREDNPVHTSGKLLLAADKLQSWSPTEGFKRTKETDVSGRLQKGAAVAVVCTAEKVSACLTIARRLTGASGGEPHTEKMGEDPTRPNYCWLPFITLEPFSPPRPRSVPPGPRPAPLKPTPGPPRPT